MNRLDAVQFADFALNGMHAVSAANVWDGDSFCFHNSLLLSVFNRKYFANFSQHALPLVGVIAANGSAQARVQVIIENHLANLCQCRLRRLNLLDHINAIAILLDHRGDAVNVPRNTFEPVYDIGFISVFHVLPHHPTPSGEGYLQYNTRHKRIQALFNCILTPGKPLCYPTPTLLNQHAASMTLERILTSEISKHDVERVRLMGWLHRLRKLGEVNFIVLLDRAGLAQAVIGPERLEPLEGLQSETVIAIEGTVVAADQAPGGFEVHDPVIEVISPVTTDIPFTLYKNRIRASLPIFLDHAVIGHRAIDRRAILKLSSGVMAGFRETLRNRDFTEIQTPKLVGTSTESGANVFPVEYFGRTAYLAQSPQFYKQIMVGVFERVFEVGPVFRAEPHSTTRHINEYVSMYPEFGFIRDHFEVMALITDAIRGILDHLKQHYSTELTLLDVPMPAFPQNIPWIHFPKAQQMLHDQFGVKDALGEPDLAPEHERLLGQWALKEHKSDFLFVTGYPMVKRPFYTHPDPADPRWSNSFDLLFRGMELVTGGQRLHRYQDYLDAAQRFKYALEPFEQYFEAFKYWMPPPGGFAIGLETF